MPDALVQAMTHPAENNAPPLHTASPLRWLYVDLNSYFASVEQQLQPRLRGRPVAVVPVETDSTCAIAASYEAKAFGVKTGTMIYEARKMCPGLICVPARHELYVEFHHRILEEVEKHIPITAVCSIDEVACRLLSNEAPEPVATRIARSIKRGLAENVGEYVRCSIGIAPNRYLAKVATELQKPDGLVALRLADLPQRLFALSLRDLPGIGYSMERRLTAAGIRSVAQLCALDAARMRKIWENVWGERMWHLLRGADLPEEVTQRRSIGHSHVMAPELRDPPKARHVARRLTLKAASRLRRMEYYASVLSFSARFENDKWAGDYERCWRAQDSLTFLHLLDGIWERIVPKGLRVKQVAVTLHGLTPAAEIEAELFDGAADRNAHRRLKAERMSRALDRLNHRYGRDTVLLGMLPAEGREFSGSKIAFTRIPDREEFRE